MAPEIVFLLACVGLSLTVAYIYWMRLRVWLLREDLFRFRGEIWSTMRDRGALDDSSYRELRETINALINMASTLSLFTIAWLIIGRVGDPQASGSPVLAEIAEARRKVASRVVRYVLYETISGLLLVALLLVLHMAAATKEFLISRVAALFSTHSFEGLAAQGKKYDQLLAG